METKFIFFVLAASLAYVSAQGGEEGPLTLRFVNPNDRQVNLGDSVDLTYQVNRDIFWALNNGVKLIRKSLVDGVLQEAIIAEGAQEQDGEPKFYECEIDSKPTMENVTVTCTIKTVRDRDDGVYELRIVQNANTDMEEIVSTSLNIVVLRPNTKIQMQFGDFKPFHESMDAALVVDAGIYVVECTAEGSNPVTENVKLYYSGEEVPVSDSAKGEVEGPVRRFKNTVSARVNIELSKSGQEVKCVAVSEAGDMLSVKAPVQVNVYDPEVECAEASAFVGQRYPTLSCTINETGHEIESYAYQFGETGTVINAGSQSKDYHEVIKTNLGNSRVKVALKLHQAERSHFAKYYLIITHKNGHVTREAVVLQETEGPKDASMMLQSSVFTLVLCAICSAWNFL